MSKIRILVLTSSTGGGHDARAQAFAEWCFVRYRHQVDVRIEQMLERSSVVNRSGVRFYNWIQKSAPILHKAYYAVIELLSLLNSQTVVLGRGYYIQVIEEYRPHLVFSVHDCLNRGYFQLARTILGSDNVKCATYCGEFSGGWGYSVNWIEPTVDLYISRTPTARDFAVKKGIPASKTSVRGHFMSPRVYSEVLTPERRRSFLVRKLGLRPDLFTVFLATGGNGANNHLELLPRLTAYGDRCQAIVICGKNADAYNELMHWRVNHPDFNCYIDGYSDHVHLLMQCSDAIVTRGGTTTCAKALHFGCPIIFNAFGGIMPQERLTWKFFERGSQAVKIETAAQFGAVLELWMEDLSTYRSYRDHFRALRYDDDPAVVVEELVGLAQQVARVQVTRVSEENGEGSADPLPR